MSLMLSSFLLVVLLSFFSVLLSSQLYFLFCVLSSLFSGRFHVFYLPFVSPLSSLVLLSLPPLIIHLSLLVPFHSLMASSFFLVVVLSLLYFTSCPSYNFFSLSCFLSSLFSFMSSIFPLLSSIFPLLYFLASLDQSSFHSLMSSLFFFVV